MSFLVHPQQSQFCPQGHCKSSPFLLQFPSILCFLGKTRLLINKTVTQVAENTLTHCFESFIRETTHKQATRTQINKEALKAHGFLQKEQIVQNISLALNIPDVQPIRAINITRNLHVYVHWGI